MKASGLSWTYLLACVVVPLLWGWAVSAFFDWLEARRHRDHPPPPLDYSI